MGEGRESKHFASYWAASPARNEARGLLQLLALPTESPDTIRQLIQVGERERREMSRRLDAVTVQKVCDYRAAVLREFENLIANGATCEPIRPPTPYFCRGRRHRHSSLRDGQNANGSGSGSRARDVSRTVGD